MRTMRTDSDGELACVTGLQDLKILDIQHDTNFEFVQLARRCKGGHTSRVPKWYGSRASAVQRPVGDNAHYLPDSIPIWNHCRSSFRIPSPRPSHLLCSLHLDRDEYYSVILQAISTIVRGFGSVGLRVCGASQVGLRVCLWGVGFWRIPKRDPE